MADDLKEFILEHFDRIDAKLDRLLTMAGDLNDRLEALDKRMAALDALLARIARGPEGLTPSSS